MSFKRVHLTRFYLVRCSEWQSAAVVDDFGNLILVEVQ